MKSFVIDALGESRVRFNQLSKNRIFWKQASDLGRHQGRKDEVNVIVSHAWSKESQLCLGVSLGQVPGAVVRLVHAAAPIHDAYFVLRVQPYLSNIPVKTFQHVIVLETEGEAPHDVSSWLCRKMYVKFSRRFVKESSGHVRKDNWTINYQDENKLKC